MVNPQKFANNLNQDDIENIYKNLCKEYETARDKNTKKNLNQQILMLILLSRGFPVQEMVKIHYDYFKPEPQNSILYKHLMEHSLNNFCQLDGLLLTNTSNRALTVDEVEDIIANIDTGNTNKKLSVNALYITNSMLNNFGKQKFNKKEIKKYLQVKSDENKTGENKTHETPTEEDIRLTDRIISEISKNIIEHLDESQPSPEGTVQLDELKEKQEILEDSLTSKHNQLSNTINKIHQNIKAQNKKYDQFRGYFNELELVKDSLNTSIEWQNDQLSRLEAMFDEVLEKVENIEKENKRNISVNMQEVEDMATEYKTLQAVSNDIDFVDLKEFVYNWFNRNLKITRSPLDAVDMNDIKVKLDKFMDEGNINLNRNLLFERLESYLSSWYKQHNTIEEFKNIKDKTINGNEFYMYLKFINLKEERENRIKNSIVAWLKDNTCEVEGSKTYTQDIFEKIEPIFSKNGWIITTHEEWKQLNDAGFSKTVPNRTFSQIIGKAVQQVYHSISKDTIRRDTSSDNGNVTWYPNIEILDKEVSSALESTMGDELSNVIFESDNLIYQWLKDNLTFTQNDGDKLSVAVLNEKILKYLQVNEIRVSQKSLETILSSVLKHYMQDNGVEFTDGEEITGFKLTVESDEQVTIILDDWMKNHLIITDNSEDKTYVEDLNEKLFTALYHEGISVLNDSLYSQLPSNLKGNVISVSQFDKIVEKTMADNITAQRVDDLDGSYYKSLKVIKYKTLNEQHLRTWIDSNIPQLLESNVASKSDIVDKFSGYIKEHNIKNNTQHSLSELLDVAIDEYYSKIGEVSFKLLNDTQNEYYVLINQ